jgi:hypothetical protein
MLRRYNLVPWEKITLLIKETNQLLTYHCTFGWTLQAYLFTPKTYSQKWAWCEFIDRFKLLLINVQEIILQKLHGKIVVCHYKIIFYTLIFHNYLIQKMASSNNLCACPNKSGKSSSHYSYCKHER